MIKTIKSVAVAAALLCPMATTSSAAPVQWETATGGNGHWYDFVVRTTAITATEAETAAESSTYLGENGYLATITSAGEQTFLNSIWPGVGSVAGQFMNYSYFLIGASDRNSEGSFEWIGGSEDGDALSYANFKVGEPNDGGSGSAGEDYVVAWWEDSVSGSWNDVPGTSILAYVVEYDNGTVSAIPLPASAWLFFAGLIGLFGIRRRRQA